MRLMGIIRRIDDLGRVVIPKEIRRGMKIREGDPLELFLTENGVEFRPYDYMQDVERAIQNLHLTVTEETNLENRDAILEKIRELKQLLQK